MPIYIKKKYLGNIPEAVSDLLDNDKKQDKAITDLDERIKQALVGVFKYKGSVATYSDLPSTDNVVGDVYNVVDTGKNYAWSGTEWDDLGGIVDLSDFVDLTRTQIISGQKIFSNGVYLGIDEKIAAGSIGEIRIFGSATTYLVLSTSLSSLIPNRNLNLGSSSNKFENIYLRNAINLGASGIMKYDSNESAFTVNSHYIPAVTDNYDLGSSDFKWRNGKFSGIIESQNTPLQWYGSQAQYDALGTYDNNTIYNILES